MKHTTRMAIFTALTAGSLASTGCNGGGGAPADDVHPFAPPPKVTVHIAPQRRLLLEPGESARVRLYTSAQTALGVDFSETEAGISIVPGSCVPAEERCQEWLFRPDARAIAGDHAVPVLIGANGETEAWEASEAVLLTVFPPERTPPVRALTAGYASVFAIDASGELWSWGQDNGKLGRKIHRPSGLVKPAALASAAGAETLARRAPSTLPDVREIAVGNRHAFALDGSGVVWAWGNRAWFALGDNQMSGRVDVPAANERLTAVVAIASSVTGGAAIAAHGSAWRWGGSTLRVPTPVPGLPPIVEIRSAASRTIARDESGGIWQWESLSSGGHSDAVRALDGGALPRLTALAPGYEHDVALDENGSIWAWGKNANGQLGDGTLVDRPSPVRVALPAGVTISAIAAGSVHSMALDTNGNVWVWGGNSEGQLGDGTFVDRAVPVHVQSLGSAVAAIAASGVNSYAVVAECGGAVRAWGGNAFGQLGIGVQAERGVAAEAAPAATPVPVAGLGESGECGGSRRLMVYLTEDASTVVSDRGTLDCPPDLRFCWAILPLGSTVTLTATSAGDRQPEWSWDCVGAGSRATVVMDDHKYCKVRVEESPLKTLTVTVSGDGRVQSSPPGIYCPDTCSAEFDTTVTPVVELSSTDHRTPKWGDGCTDGRIVLNSDTECDVTFDDELGPPSALLVERGGAGTGTVTSTPAGIDCGLDCSEQYATPVQVVLRAVADAGSRFSHWEGDSRCPADTSASGTANVDGETRCTAVFDLVTAPTTATLSIEIDELVGSAAVRTGTVTSAPAGIQCGNGDSDCSESYPLGTEVTLSAASAAGSRLRGWNGDPDCEDGHVTLDASKTCSAVFDSEGSTGRASLTFAIVGNGTVATSDGAIVCPGDCSAIYDFNETVLVGVTPAAGEQFLGWDGPCASAGTQSAFSMALVSDVSCTARFGQPPAGTALTVSLIGSGAIHVYEGTSLLLQCPAGGTPCTIARPVGSLLHVLWAAPGPGLDFLGWGGDCAAQQTRTSFNLTLDRAYVCTATSE